MAQEQIAGIYKRISTGEQSNFSLDAQEDELKKYCKEHNLKVGKVYMDTKGRFTFEERSGLMQLLDDVEQGKINIILVTELDRLAGDEGILGYIRYTLKRYNTTIISVNEQNKVKNEYEELIDGILTAVAKFENKRKQLRCRRGIAKAKEEGKHLSRSPFGYKRIKKGERYSEIVIDEDKGKIVQDIFARIGKGENIYQIAKALKLSKSNVRYIIKNRFYCDGDYKGKHTPLISVEAYDKVNKNKLQDKLI